MKPGKYREKTDMISESRTSGCGCLGAVDWLRVPMSAGALGREKLIVPKPCSSNAGTDINILYKTRYLTVQMIVFPI